MYKEQGYWQNRVGRGNQGTLQGNGTTTNASANATTTNASASAPPRGSDIRDFDFSKKQEFKIKNEPARKQQAQQPQRQQVAVTFDVPDIAEGRSQELGSITRELGRGIFAGLAMQDSREPTRQFTTFVDMVTAPSPQITPNMGRTNGPRISAPSYRGGRR